MELIDALALQEPLELIYFALQLFNVIPIAEFVGSALAMILSVWGITCEAYYKAATNDVNFHRHLIDVLL